MSSGGNGVGGGGSRTRAAAAAAADADQFNRDWAATLGLALADAHFGRTRLAGRALADALAALPGWELEPEGDHDWIAARFEFSVFEAAALFVNFLFATVQMTTCRVAPAIVARAGGEVAVRLADPEVGGITEEVAFFAALLNRGFFLEADKPAGDDGGGRRSR